MKCLDKKQSVIVVPDLHGKDFWKKIKPKNFDKIIFLGDYVDDFYLPNDQIISNLIEIISFKKKYPKKVELLLGNHDLQYSEWPDNFYRCSGFRPSYQEEITKIFKNNNKGIFKVAFSIENFLFTHAGVSKKWLMQNSNKVNGGMNTELSWSISDSLNIAHFCGGSRSKYMLHSIPKIRGGLSDAGGITWADITEFKSENLPPKIHQICGHNEIEEISKIENKKLDASITFCDVLNFQVEFLKVTI